MVVEDELDYLEISTNNQTVDTPPCSCPSSTVVPYTELCLEGIAIPLLGGAGILGNVAAVVVLRSPEMRSSFNQLLVALSVIDSLYVITGIVDYSLVKVFQLHPLIYTYLFPYVWYPVKNILMSWTTNLTMALATERYLAVCRPLLYRSLELTYSCRVRVLSYLLPAMLLSVALNIPKFLEARLDTHEWIDERNVTREVVIYNVTSLRVDPDYMYYYIHWTRLLCTGVIPFLYLSILNLLIYSRVRQNALSSVRSRSTTTRKAGNLATILIVIVLVFLVSNIPRLVLNLTELLIHTTASGRSECGCDPTPEWYLVMISVNHLFLTINSSVNFLIYCSVGEKFKKVVVRFLRTNILNNMTSSESGTGLSGDDEGKTEVTEDVTVTTRRLTNDNCIKNGNQTLREGEEERMAAISQPTILNESLM